MIGVGFDYTSFAVRDATAWLRRLGPIAAPHP
jgi:hypothetical protein